MDRQLLERMVGAAVLIVVLVLIVPAVLDGPETTVQREPGATLAGGPMRTVTIRPAAEASQPPIPAPRPDGTAETGEDTVTAAQRAAAAAIKPAAGPAAKPTPEPSASAEPPAATPPPRQPATSGSAKLVRPGGWAVQLGSFARRDNASRLAQQVEAKGFASYIEPLSSGGRTLYRVRVGPVPDRDAAGRLSGRLAAAGYRGQVVRQAGD